MRIRNQKKKPAVRTAKKAVPMQANYVETTRDYTIEGLCEAIGVDQRVVREARANGLPAKLFGDRRVIIRGEDVDDWLKNQAADAPVPKGKTK